MEQLFTDSRLDTRKIFAEKCPYLEDGFCTISGIERETAGYIDKNSCYSNEWNKCSIYISQFFYDPNDNY